jgi:hypothetical protein
VLRVAYACVLVVAVTCGLFLAVGAFGGGGGSKSTSAAANLHPAAGNFKPDDTKLSQCGTNRECYEQAFGNLAYYEGPKTALAKFDEMIKSNQTVAADCHRTAHVIGAGALARIGDVGKAFAEGTASCWSGYYHGILERAFTNVTPTVTALSKKSIELCADPTIRRVQWIAYQCVHGLGHGLMLYSGYRLPFALAVCDHLATSWDQTSCTGGVFMENVVSSYGTKSPWLRDNDGVYPCRQMKERHKLYCYLMATSRILQVNNYDWPKTASTCKTVEKNWVETCFASMGRDASGQTTQNPKEVIGICAYAGRMWWDDCVYGAARDMAATFSNGTRASQLCNRLPATMRPNCFWNVGTILGSMKTTAPERRELCVATTQRYLNDCVGGAQAATA